MANSRSSLGTPKKRRCSIVELSVRKRHYEKFHDRYSFRPINGLRGSRLAARRVCALERPLVTYAARILGDADRAGDVVQDVFLRLCRQDQSQIEPILAQWLFTVCRNRALDVCKKENRMSRLSDRQAADAASREGDHAAAAQQRDEARAAIAMLEQLPPNQREVIRLKLQNDLSYREISEVTGHSVSNVGYLLHVGLKTLRERYFRGAEPA